MSSPIVTMLASQPPQELERLRAKMQTEHERLTSDMARLNVEIAQVDEALGRQARRRNTSFVVTHTRRGPRTPDRVLAVLQGAPEPMSPNDIVEVLRTDGFTGSVSAVHNALAKLTKAGDVRKPVEDAPLYEATSRNGTAAAEATLGPSENGASEALSLPAQPQEGFRTHQESGT
jgi:hypothetical protein